jgi:hypothetical protein
MVTKKIIKPEEHCSVFPFKRISWTAIFVGALVGLGLTFLLTLFGVAIGLSAITVNKSGASAIAIGGLSGIAIAIVASMITAGYASGYLGRIYAPKRNLGILYGFTTWSVSLLLCTAVWSHIGQYAATYSQSVIGSTVVIENVGNTAANKDNSERKTTKTEVSSANIACGAYIIFGLFFLGAFCTCFGACCGMRCGRDD